MLRVEFEEIITPIILTNGALGLTDEALLIGNDNKILSSLAHPLADGSIAEPLKYEIGTEAAMSAAAGLNGTTSSTDYRGVKVLAAYRYIEFSPSLGWGLVVKQDESEIFDHLRTSVTQAVWVGIVGSALILAIAFVSASNLTRPIRALERAMVRVGKGDRSISLFDTSGDEIGRLTAEFNTMTTSLSHQEQELQIRGAAMDAAHEMIVIIDSSGIIEYINNAFTEETGYSSEEMIGNTMRVLKSEHQSHDFYLDLWGTVLGGRVWTGTLVNKRKDGTEYPEEMVATPITDDEGNVVRIIAIKREISQRIRMESEREISRFLESKNNELERLNEARSEFLSSVSHELRTPLTSILAFSDIIRRNRDDNLKPLQIEQLELISKGGRRLDEMIEELLDVSRSVSGKFTLNRIPFDVQESIEELSSIVMGIFDERRQKLEIVNLLNPTLMNGDRGRIMQVFSNLLTNASKYSPPGSSVEFVARAENDVLEMTIVDQGMGISAEDQQKLFIPFFRAENGQMDGVRGTGLGLVVVKTIVELHGGRIEIDSEVGMGTTVRAWIPGILPEAP